MYRLALGLLCFYTLAIPAESFAHARWKLDGIVKPRDNATGLKTAPCGNVSRTTKPAVFSPGETITVEWEETINHPGYFRIAFSPAGDQGFDSYVLADNIVDTQDDANTPHFYSRQITLPDMACTDCTLQLIQYMTENPAAPSLYYSCGDINLTLPVTSPQPVTDVQATAQANSVLLSWRNPVQEYFQSSVLMANQPIVAAPLDGERYVVGDRLGNASVVYTGASRFHTIQNMTPGQTYFFAVTAQNTRLRYAPLVTTQINIPVVAENTPPQVSLARLQNNTLVSTVSTDGSPVIVRSRVTDPDANDIHVFDWSLSDNRLVDMDAQQDTFTFDPAELQAGSYRIVLTVTDSGQPPARKTVQDMIQVITPPTSGSAPAMPSTPDTSTTPTVTPEAVRTAGGGAWSILTGVILCLFVLHRRR